MAPCTSAVVCGRSALDEWGILDGAMLNIDHLIKRGAICAAEVVPVTSLTASESAEQRASKERWAPKLVS